MLSQSRLFHFKEEFGLLPILRMVSLGSKVYSIQLACCHDLTSHPNGECKNHNNKSVNSSESSTCNFSDKLVLKGISKFSKKNFTFEDYFNCLKEDSLIRVLDYRIQSKKQKLTSTILHKIALSTFCDKRYILDCGIHSVPYGMTTNSKCYAIECYRV